MLSGGLGGCFWKVFGTTFGYLEASFVDEFKEVRVFARSANSTLSPDRLFPRYPCGRWLLAFSVSKFCLFRSVVCVSNCLRVHARESARARVLGTLQA